MPRRKFVRRSRIIRLNRTSKRASCDLLGIVFLIMGIRLLMVLFLRYIPIPRSRCHPLPSIVVESPSFHHLFLPPPLVVIWSFVVSSYCSLYFVAVDSVDNRHGKIQPSP